MIKRIVAACLAVALGLINASAASADPGGEGRTSGVPDPIIAALITNDDAFALADLSVLLASPTNPGGNKHYGPFASSSPDSGTCGNDWATDYFNRFFTVRQSGPTSYTVVQQFKNGTFVTNPGLSPGACEVDDGSSTVFVEGGLNGTMHGYFIITVTGATTYNADPNCVVTGPCTTAGFIANHFPGATYDIPTYFFHFAGKDGTNQVLIEHEWKNASEDRGGNHGDIATE